MQETSKQKSVIYVRSVCENELKHLGLWKFAGAVMYVLHEALSYRGTGRDIVQNMVCCVEEDTWNKIAGIWAPLLL